MKRNRIKTKMLSVLAILFMTITQAQIQNLEQAKTYTIAGIDIEGGTTYRKNTIIAFTGLKVNDKITVPSPKLNKVIKKLWATDLFENVDFFVNKIEGNSIYFRLKIEERPKIENVIVKGLSKTKQKELIEDNGLKKGERLTQNKINEIKNHLKTYYANKGFLNPKIDLTTNKNAKGDKVNITLNLDEGKRVKVGKISFEGNTELKNSKLKKVMKNTKAKFFGRVWKKSKYIKEDYQEDLKSIIAKYQSYGFRDAKIISDTVFLANGDIQIKMNIDEGKRYYLRDIKFTGNTEYTEELLRKILTYTEGDAYDLTGILKKVNESDKDDDIASLYYDNGYIFNQISPVETTVKGDSIELEIRIKENSQATLNKVTFTGNDTTNDHVITRNLRTLPGDLFSRSKLKRTMRELAQLSYFDPEQIKPDVQPNQQTNTVDINYELAEKGSSEVQLQGGWGGGRLIGTLALTFNNFSLRNLLNGEEWRPVPLGDGQTLSLRAQAARFFQSYSFSFIEPWLGGTTPTSLSFSVYHSIYDNSFFDNNSKQVEAGKLKITGASVGLTKRLTKPDDFFTLSQAISYQRYNLDNYFIRTFDFRNGNSNDLNYKITLARRSSGPNPIFPMGGSDFSLSLKMTPPYSFFNDIDDRWNELSGAEKFKWLEYYKIKFKGDWYKQIAGKFVLKMSTEFGMLKNYNSILDIPPFERFYMGGTGLTAGGFDGRETIPLRGYDDPSSTGGGPNDITPTDGGVIYNKLSIEARYPITLSQTASIYALGFFEGGSLSSNYENFNPFELKRAAGVGVRIFMPAFGLLGVDWGYGFDPYVRGGKKSGSQVHFIIGQQF